MSAATASATPRTAPIALWRIAEALLNTLYALFGAPEDVAFRHTLTSKAHAQLATWLRTAEALLRRLLVIEASAYPKPNTRPLLHAKRKRARKLMGFDEDHPEQWRVSFRCLGARRLRRRMSLKVAADARPEATRSNFRSAWPLAERYEALLRIFNNPAPHAKRLSARLHAKPHTLKQTLRAPPDAQHRVERFAEIGAEGEARWAPVCDSS